MNFAIMDFNFESIAILAIQLIFVIAVYCVVAWFFKSRNITISEPFATILYAIFAVLAVLILLKVCGPALGVRL